MRLRTGRVQGHGEAGVDRSHTDSTWIGGSVHASSSTSPPSAAIWPLIGLKRTMTVVGRRVVEAGKPAKLRGVGRAAAVQVLALLAALVGGMSLWACAAQPSSAEDTPAEVRVSATVVASSLAATDAIADFGIEEGVRMVKVRIVDELQMELRIETEGSVSLAGPPRVCLVGPFWAPDDAGLTDRCWGEPDLGGLLAAHLATDVAGHPMFGDRPIVLAAKLRRGDVRCDYPPGDWQLEVRLQPLVNGSSVGATDLSPVAFIVPAEVGNPRPLSLIRATRYCGLANVVYREQGEPPVATSP